MKSCKEGVNDFRDVKRDKEGKGAKRFLLKIFIEENVKEGNGVRMGERWELLEDKQLCKEGKKTF